MKKEIKYTLLSFPVIYLLFAIGSTLIFGRASGFVEFIYTAFGNGLLFSIYFFPAYIVIPTITFFIVRYLRIKHQAVLNMQSDGSMTTHAGVKNLIWAVVIIVILFVLCDLVIGTSFFNME